MTYNACNEDTYNWNFGDGITSDDPNPSHTYSSPGVYLVRLIVTNECGADTAQVPINIVTDPIAAVNWSEEDTTVCLNEVVSLTDITSTFGATTWSIMPNDTSRWMFTDTLMNAYSDSIAIRFKAVGTYTVRLQAMNACGTDIWEEVITVLDAPTMTLAPGPVLCETNAVYTPSVTYTGQQQILSYAWTFAGGTPASSPLPNPSNITFNTPGNHAVNLTIGSECGFTSASTTVVVDSQPQIVLPPAGQYCSGSSPDTLTGSPIGGTWSGPGVTGDSIYVFNPGSVPPGSHVLTYTVVNGTCTATETMTVVVLPSAIVTVMDLQVCEDAGQVALTATPAGGTWSGTGVVDPSGIFDTQVSGVGMFSPMYTYVDVDGCVVEANATVDVQVLPTVSLLDSTLLCDQDITVQLADLLQLTASPTGGTAAWMVDQQPSDGTINGNGLSGTLAVDLNYTLGECAVQDSAIIAIIAPSVLVLSADTVVCINDSVYQLQSNLPGVWSGPGVNSSTGLIDLDVAGAGLHAYTFVHAAGTSCERSGAVNVTINDPGLALNAGPDVSLCFGQAMTHTFNGFTPAGGTWSGTALIDPVAGIVDLTALAPDSLYTYSYCLEDNQVAGCLACDRLTLIVHALPDPGFAINGLACLNTPFDIAADTCATGSTYTWSFGNGDTASGCNVSYTYGTTGDFQLTLQVVSVYGCTNGFSLPLHVTAPPLATFDLLVDEGCAPFPVQVINQSAGEIDNQQWFIDGDTIAGSDPGAILLDGITQDSFFVIELQVANGCATSVDTDTILVHPYPIVDIGLSVDEGCSPLLIDFGNATLGNPETWAWDLGNGVMSTDSIPPPQSYTTPDDSVSTYVIQLISTNACGADTAVEFLTVYPPDVTAFLQMDTTGGCQPLEIRPVSVSSPGAVIGWQVIGPDGQVTGSNDIAPVFTLDQPGVHTVILSASRCGSDFDTAQVRVLPAPLLEFNVPDVVCQGDPILIENLSADITGILWDLGNGEQSTAFNPVVTYDAPGTYTITLTARSLVNDCPSVRSTMVTVRPKPLLSIDAGPYSGCPPVSISFGNTGAVDLSYVWQFMDGTPQSTEYAPDHVFTATGQYGVAVYAFDVAGCISDTLVIPVTVFDVPISAFTVPDPRYCARHDSILADNLSTGATGYTWLLNGQLAGTDPLALLPDTPGVYAIDLIAENGFGCRDTVSQSIDVLASPVAAFAVDPDAGCAPLAVVFENLSTFSTGYLWDFGEGNTSVAVDPAFTYVDDGQYNVLLTAVNANGCPQDTASVLIDVWPVPEAAFTFAKAMTCGVPVDVQFDNASAGALDYAWEFGDGGASVAAEPVHTYAAAGAYGITLVATNAFLCRDTASAIVDVYEQPIADFILLEDRVCQRDTVSLINNSLHGNAYYWYLDGDLAAGTTDHAFVAQESGTHTVTLIAEYNALCRDTFIWMQAFEVFLSPTADFTYEADLDPQLIGDVQFTNLSVQYDRVLWDFGDGQSSTEDDPFHEYDINRAVEVWLYAYHDNMGRFTCVDSVRNEVDPEWITTFFAPNAFSPDYGEEGIRVFKPVGIGLADYSISVYSPWGQRVWHSTALDDTHPAESWNGRLDNTGEELPQGAFTWLAEVEFVNGVRSVYKGSVTLLR